MASFISGTQPSPTITPIGNAEIPEDMVKKGIDAIIARMTPAYFDLIRQATENPKIISNYANSLRHQYDLIGSPEEKVNEVIRKFDANRFNEISKPLSNKEKISVYYKLAEIFNITKPIENARLYIRLNVNVKDLKTEDSLDLLLSQLRDKLLTLGYGGTGYFDIRLEKGFLTLEGEPWFWHYDGASFKTSITVCYSNQKNWSTHIGDSLFVIKAAEHGFLYNAHNVYHRPPLPSDLEGVELTPSDYRLFIRYIERP